MIAGAQSAKHLACSGLGRQVLNDQKVPGLSEKLIAGTYSINCVPAKLPGALAVPTHDRLLGMLVTWRHAWQCSTREDTRWGAGKGCQPALQTLLFPDGYTVCSQAPPQLAWGPGVASDNRFCCPAPSPALPWVQTPWQGCRPVSRVSPGEAPLGPGISE